MLAAGLVAPEQDAANRSQIITRNRHSREHHTEALLISRTISCHLRPGRDQPGEPRDSGEGRLETLSLFQETDPRRASHHHGSGHIQEQAMLDDARTVGQRASQGVGIGNALWKVA